MVVDEIALLAILCIGFSFSLSLFLIINTFYDKTRTFFVNRLIRLKSNKIKLAAGQIWSQQGILLEIHSIDINGNIKIKKEYDVSKRLYWTESYSLWNQRVNILKLSLVKA